MTGITKEKGDGADIYVYELCRKLSNYVSRHVSVIKTYYANIVKLL